MSESGMSSRSRALAAHWSNARWRGWARPAPQALADPARRERACASWRWPAISPSIPCAGSPTCWTRLDAPARCRRPRLEAGQRGRLAGAAASLACGRIHAPGLARRARPRRRGRHPGRQQPHRRTGLQAGTGRAGGAVRAARMAWCATPQGDAQSLVVFGLGKLGGGELNFSSDIDLVYAFPEDGEQRWRRVRWTRRTTSPAWASAWRNCWAKSPPTASAIASTCACGRSAPPGRVALSFAAMEQYFQREGRDWERYAWIKARPVAGDIDAGERLLETLRPFVYRRYLDYTALDGLREMKALIDAEVQRRETGRRPQARTRRHPRNRIPGAGPAADPRRARAGAARSVACCRRCVRLAEAGHLDADDGARAGRGLPLPAPAGEPRADAGRRADACAARRSAGRARIARGLGYRRRRRDAARRSTGIARVVAAEFGGLLQAPRREPEAMRWRSTGARLPDGGDARSLADAGFADAAEQHAALRDFARSPAVRGSVRARAAAAGPRAAGPAGGRGAAAARPMRRCRAASRCCRRSRVAPATWPCSTNSPAALARLVDVTARSALLAERLAAHPLLLDELLDCRVGRRRARCATAGAHQPIELRRSRAGDTEAALVGA